MRQIDDLRLVRLGFLGNSIGFAARTRQNVIAIGLRFIAGALLISSRPLHIIERVDDGKRRINALQLNLSYENSRLIGIQQPLEHVGDLVGDLLTAIRQSRLYRVARDDLPHRTLGGQPKHRLRIIDLEQVFAGALDLPCNHAVCLH